MPMRTDPRASSAAGKYLRHSSISVRDFAVYRGFPLREARGLEGS
jgi:hypothetical protein